MINNSKNDGNVKERILKQGYVIEAKSSENDLEDVQTIVHYGLSLVEVSLISAIYNAIKDFSLPEDYRILDDVYEEHFDLDVAERETQSFRNVCLSVAREFNDYKGVAEFIDLENLGDDYSEEDFIQFLNLLDVGDLQTFLGKYLVGFSQGISQEERYQVRALDSLTIYHLPTDVVLTNVTEELLSKKMKVS